MDLLFDNNEVEKYFSDLGLMQKKIGKDMTKMVKKRIDQLRACDEFETFISLGVGKLHRLEGDPKGIHTYAVRLTANYRIIFKLAETCSDMNEIKLCKAIVIKGVDDYHGTKNNWIIP